MLWWAILIGLLVFALVNARSWAVWYLAKLAEEERAERHALAYAAMDEIEEIQEAALNLTIQATMEYIVSIDPKFARPVKAATVINRARQYGDPRAFLRNYAADPDVEERYEAWRATQTSRRRIRVAEFTAVS